MVRRERRPGTLRTGAIAIAVAGAIPVMASLGAPVIHSTTLVSPGTAPFDAAFVGASADGSRVWFTTTQPIPGTGDTDTAVDIYERVNGGPPQLVSAGTANVNASFYDNRGASVIYFTDEAIPGTGDVDSSTDVYERTAAGATRLVSQGTANAPALPGGASADGTRIWYFTSEPIPGTGDVDTARDVYETTSAGTTRLISAGTQNVDVTDLGITGSSDGSRVWFTTPEQIAGTGEFDATNDVFERHASGVVALVSGGTPGADAVFAGASADGSRVRFSTTDAIAGTGDVDTTSDIYERSAGTTTLVSGGTANAPVVYEGASPDGSRVWYFTSEAIAGTGDADAAFDVYERGPGGTRLISGGAAGSPAQFLAAPGDGSRVLFTTVEPLLPEDPDGFADVYERAADGTLRLASPATPGADAIWVGSSSDASRIWFQTSEGVAGVNDLDGAIDVYEYGTGVPRLVTPGVASVPAWFSGASASGDRVWFHTVEAIPGAGDANSNDDVYQRAWGIPVIPASIAIAGNPKVGNVLICAGEPLVGEEVGPTTVQWLVRGSSVPGATSDRYLVRPGDAGAPISCRMSATNPVGTGSAESAAVVIAPHVARRARIVGFPIRGQRIACPATVLGATSRVITWRRGARRVGAGPRYRLRPADLGKLLTCRVRATGPGGVVTTTSTRRTIPRACRVPAVRGRTVALARRLLGNRACRTRVVRVRGTGVRRGLVLGSIPRARAIRPNGAVVILRVRR